jgi:hypothetical protein
VAAAAITEKNTPPTSLIIAIARADVFLAIKNRLNGMPPALHACIAAQFPVPAEG